MDKTALFDQTASAKKVALEGYEGMIEGKLDIISGLSFSQKMLTSLLPLTPKKLILKQIKKMQEIK